MRGPQLAQPLRYQAGGLIDEITRWCLELPLPPHVPPCPLPLPCPSPSPPVALLPPQAPRRQAEGLHASTVAPGTPALQDSVRCYILRRRVGLGNETAPARHRGGAQHCRLSPSSSLQLPVGRAPQRYVNGVASRRHSQECRHSSSSRVWTALARRSIMVTLRLLSPTNQSQPPSKPLRAWLHGRAASVGGHLRGGGGAQGARHNKQEQAHAHALCIPMRARTHTHPCWFSWVSCLAATPRAPCLDTGLAGD